MLYSKQLSISVIASEIFGFGPFTHTQKYPYVIKKVRNGASLNHESKNVAQLSEAVTNDLVKSTHGLKEASHHQLWLEHYPGTNNAQ